MKSRSHGSRRAFFYGCTSYHLRGRTICKNALEIPMLSANESILNAFQNDILRPEHVERVIRAVAASLQPSVTDREARRSSLSAELTTIERELERLTSAISAGGDLASLLSALKTRESRKRTLQEELANLGAAQSFDVSSIEAEARRRLREWKSLLQTDAVPQARQMLRKLIGEEQLVAAPFKKGDRRGWEFRIRPNFAKLLTGLMPANTVASQGLPSWNQVASFLEAMRQLRDSGHFAA